MSKTHFRGILPNRSFTQSYLQMTTGSRSSAAVLRVYGRAKEWAGEDRLKMPQKAVSVGFTTSELAVMDSANMK